MDRERAGDRGQQTTRIGPTRRGLTRIGQTRIGPTRIGRGRPCWADSDKQAQPQRTARTLSVREKVVCLTEQEAPSRPALPPPPRFPRHTPPRVWHPRAHPHLSPLARANTRARTHAHARARTRTRTHTHAHARTRTRTHIRARAHTRTHIYRSADLHRQIAAGVALGEEDGARVRPAEPSESPTRTADSDGRSGSETRTAGQCARRQGRVVQGEPARAVRPATAADVGPDR